MSRSCSSRRCSSDLKGTKLRLPACLCRPWPSCNPLFLSWPRCDGWLLDLKCFHCETLLGSKSASCCGWWWCCADSSLLLYCARRSFRGVLALTSPVPLPLCIWKDIFRLRGGADDCGGGAGGSAFGLNLASSACFSASRTAREDWMPRRRWAYRVAGAEERARASPPPRRLAQKTHTFCVDDAFFEALAGLF